MQHLQMVRAIGKTFLVHRDAGFVATQQNVCLFPGAHVLSLLRRLALKVEMGYYSPPTLCPSRVIKWLSKGKVKERMMHGYRSEGLLVDLHWLSGEPIRPRVLRDALLQHSLTQMAVVCIDLVMEYVFSGANETDVSKAIRLSTEALPSEELGTFEEWKQRLRGCDDPSTAD